MSGEYIFTDLAENNRIVNDLNYFKYVCEVPYCTFYLT